MKLIAATSLALLTACSGVHGDVDVTDANAGTPLDTTSPAVRNVSRVGSRIQGGSAISYNVRFSKNVVGVTTNAFTVSATGVSGAIPASVSGSGASYLVTVSCGSGDGTIRLDLTDGSHITDLNHHVVDQPFSDGDDFQIARSSPIVNSLAASRSQGSNTISILGSGFYIGALVKVGGVDCPATFVSTAKLTCIVPVNSSGATNLRTVDVYVEDPNGFSYTKTNGLVYLGSPLVWLDADDSGTVVTSSGKVSQWTDKSANGNDAIQTNASARPSPATQGSGRGSIRFTTTQYLLLGDAVTLRPTSSLAFFSALQVRSGTSDYGGYFTYPYYTNQSWGNPYMSYRIELRTGGAANVSLATETSSGSSFQYTTTSGSSFPLATDRLITAYSNSAIDWIGVNAGAFSASNPRTSSVSYQPLAVGSRYAWIGLDSGGGPGFTGDAYEILLYGSDLTPAERSLVETYLNSKWTIY